MKKIITFTAALAVASTGAFAQDYIAGLDFVVGQDFTSDVTFDKGTEASLFTLNVQTGVADDFVSPFGFTDAGWAATGDTYSDGNNSIPVGTPGFEATVFQTGGFAPSTDLFGNTSANAQGFSSTAGATFTAPGIFTITSSSAITDLSIQFDAAALSSGGTLVVGGNNVNLATAASNTILSLPDLSAGSAITFDLSGLSNGAVFDNILFAGTVVPEPSTYAAIAGALALAFVAYRRRRS